MTTIFNLIHLAMDCLINIVYGIVSLAVGKYILQACCTFSSFPLFSSSRYYRLQFGSVKDTKFVSTEVSLNTMMISDT